MLKTVKARYRNGVIEPLEEIDLADGTEILNESKDCKSPRLTCKGILRIAD